jgi:hypothetical protein
MLAQSFTSLSREFKSQIWKNIVNRMKMQYYVQIQDLRRKTILGFACVPLKIRYSILPRTYGKPIEMKKIKNSKFPRQLISFTPQIKKLDMKLYSEM